MEELSVYIGKIKYYEALAQSTTSVIEYDNARDSLAYYRNLKIQLERRLFQLRSWENYLSAIEKVKMVELGGDSDDYVLTNEEKTAMAIWDKGETRIFRK